MPKVKLKTRGCARSTASSCAANEGCVVGGSGSSTGRPSSRRNAPRIGCTRAAAGASSCASERTNRLSPNGRSVSLRTLVTSASICSGDR
jgi:hypothetical protein